MVILDVAGRDVGPILVAHAVTYQLPLTLLLACAKAESGMDPEAFRNGVWPDVSVGPYQQTLLYAPIGDHTQSVANVALCRAGFTDWGFATNVAAAQLAVGYQAAGGIGFKDDEQIIAALSKYNAGSVQTPGNWWWTGPNCASYRSALTWAHKQLGD